MRGVHVWRTSNGWTCSGNIQYDLGYPRTRPILCGKKLVVVERCKKGYLIRGFKIIETPMNFIRDNYYITALSLANGRKIYRTKLYGQGHPLQVIKIWPWGENVVVWGYYQTEPGDNRVTVVQILNSKGRIINQFGLKVQPTALDQKNNLLICGSKTFLLPSGLKQPGMNLMPFVDMATDKKGNLYVNHLSLTGKVWKDYIEKKTPNMPATIAKYRIEARERLWSKKSKTERGYPRLLRYEDGLLWWAVRDEHMGGLIEERTKWIGGPINVETGQFVETERKCDPYRLQTVFGGKSYTVTRKGTKLVVNIAPDKKVAN